TLIAIEDRNFSRSILSAIQMTAPVPQSN
ncbi:MAG: hypothetical protein QOF56_891, partial [Acidobacteriaceae bacterium]|nr:hypothetical protein [Acidobacteriaceae bacterium]